MENPSFGNQRQEQNGPNNDLRENNNYSRYLLFNRVIKTACSARSYQESLDYVTRELHLILGGDRVALLLKDPTSQVLRVKAMAGYPDNIKEIEIPEDEEKIKWVTRHQRPLRINNAIDDKHFREMTKKLGSVLVIPLSFQADNLGVLILESDQVNAYTESDEILFDILGTLLAVISVNRQLSEKIYRLNERESLTTEAATKIHLSTTSEQIISSASILLGKYLNAQTARIEIITDDPASDNPSYVYSSNTSLKVQGQNLYLIDFPITFRNIKIGSIYLGRFVDWTADDKKIIETIAIHVASAIETVKLLADNQKAVLREQMLGDISGKIWSSPSIELILQTAVKELGGALNADEAIIKLE